MNAISNPNFSGASPIALANAITASLPAGWNVIEGGARATDPEPDHEPVDSPELADPVADDDAYVADDTPEVRPVAIATGEFTIARDAIGKVLADLVRVVERRNTFPILSNVLLRAGDGVLVASATDLDMQLSAVVECGVGAFSGTLPAHLLSDIFKKGAGSDDVLFRASDDGCTVMVHVGGRLNFKLNPLPASDFPSLSPGELPHRFTMPGAAFRGALESTSRAVSKEETRYYLNGVYLHRDHYGNRSELRAVATDGHRLYRCDMDAPEGSENMSGIIVPRSAVSVFLALTKGKACPDVVTIECSDTKIRLSFGDLELLSKLIDGAYPDYPRVMPTGNDKVGTFETAAFLEAIESVSLVSPEKGRAVRLNVEAERCTFTVNNPDAGSATMDMPCTLAKHGDDSPAIEIGFNAKYLMTMLADLADDGEEFTAEFADSGSPTVFRSGREGFTAVLMPMRV